MTEEFTQNTKPAEYVPILPTSHIKSVFTCFLKKYADRQSFKFINSCLTNESSLIHSVAMFGVWYGRYDFFLGYNVKFYAQECNAVAVMQAILLSVVITSFVVHD